MKGRYQAAFLVPIGTKKFLGEYGWEFESSDRLSAELKDYLIDSLKLSYLESYLGVESYVGSNMKMTVVFDDENKIESIYFQLYNDALSMLSELCKTGKVCVAGELFIPHQLE